MIKVVLQISLTLVKMCHLHAIIWLIVDNKSATVIELKKKPVSLLLKLLWVLVVNFTLIFYDRVQLSSLF